MTLPYRLKKKNVDLEEFLGYAEIYTKANDGNIASLTFDCRAPRHTMPASRAAGKLVSVILQDTEGRGNV